MQDDMALPRKPSMTASFWERADLTSESSGLDLVAFYPQAVPTVNDRLNGKDWK